MSFIAISYAFQQCKKFENRLRFDKVRESLKVGRFLRHSVYTGGVYTTYYLIHYSPVF